jgi:serine/threonine protein kinase/tetratricopeptide (TPR) repeat protein
VTESLLPNSNIFHYRIISKLGAGGMGEVYLAHDTKLDRKVALKILPPEVADDKDRMDRFVREAKSASALNQPNIITIYEIGETEGTHFIATEYIQGETLHTQLRQSPLELRAALDVAIQMASALDAAHRAGIIHRDIKPENVMIRPDGVVKILDFGIAKLTEERRADAETLRRGEERETLIAASPRRPVSASHKTDPGVIIGTANYMSPEQARGREVAAQSDIFSFGIVLYEMVTGKRAFVGENALDVIGAILHTEPTPLNQLAPDLPHEIERIINKTLRKDPNTRYQTARDLLTDLKDAREELEFQDKLERTVAPHSETPTTQTIIPPSTDGLRAPTSSAEFITQEVQKHKLGVVLGSLIVLALVGVGLWFFYFRASAANKAISSIAVLPFQNKSSDADTDYLSDGLAESLIYRLSQLPNLKVSPTSAVMRYKGKELDAQQIAKELGVQAVMSGRLIQRGENLSISVELVDAANNKIIWGEQYERKMSDLLATQREIASTITEKLQLKLSGESAKGITKKYTESSEAYQLYLKGRYLWNQRTGESLKRATVVYNQAIEKDPGFALAYAALAETYALFPNYEVASPADSLPQAKAAALRAMELDDSLAEAHSALGWYLCQYEFDWIGGEKEFRRAIELNPNYATAHQWLASLFASTKRFDDAQAEIKRAAELDPLSPIIAVNISFNLWEARRYDEALKEFDRTLSLHPDFPVAQQGLCWTYSAMGKSELAINACRKALDLAKGAWDKGRLSQVLGRAGHTDEAKKLLQELETESREHYIPKMALALAHMGLNQKEEALTMIEQDVAEHGYWVGSMGVEPEFDELRSDPRFKALLKRANLPE